MILIIALIILLMTFTAARRELEGLKVQHAEMGMLKSEFASLKTRIDEVERKKKLMKVDGIISALDEIFSSLGLKNKIKAIKSIGNKEVSGSIEEDVEVLVERINMNEMVNLFYRIENAPMLLMLRKVNIKTSFEKPELLNLNLTISLVHEK